MGIRKRRSGSQQGCHVGLVLRDERRKHRSLRQAHPSLRSAQTIVEIDPADVGLTEVRKTYVPVTFVESAAAVHREATLAHDFADIRELVFPGDKRKLMDMRRSGVVEGHRERHRCGRSLGEGSAAQTSSTRPMRPLNSRRSGRPMTPVCRAGARRELQ
jgi:hypothetical protein